jgi:hypothetical protein
VTMRVPSGLNDALYIGPSALSGVPLACSYSAVMIESRGLRQSIFPYAGNAGISHSIRYAALAGSISTA